MQLAIDVCFSSTTPQVSAGADAICVSFNPGCEKGVKRLGVRERASASLGEPKGTDFWGGKSCL